MKFGKYISRHTVPEWKDAYIQYKKIKKLLGPGKIILKLYVKTKFENGKQIQVVINARETDLTKLNDFNKQFEIILFCELLTQVEVFKVEYSNIVGLKTKLQFSQLLFRSVKQLKFSYHLYWKELNLFSEWIDINNEAIRKLLKKNNKIMKIFLGSEYQSLNTKMDKIKNRSYITRNKQSFIELMNEVQSQYIKFFYTKFTKKTGLEELEQVAQRQTLLMRGYILLYGLFLGFTIVSFLIIIIAVIQEWFDPKVDQNFKFIFPMFRGVILFILYIWLLAMNVWGWNKFNVNYKMIFKFNHHYSTTYQILRRAAFFTFVFLLMFLVYIGETVQNKLTKYLDVLPLEYTPLVVWAAFLGYVFFPSNHALNGPGRVYFYKLLRKCIFSSFYPMEFRISWATDQIVSFVGPLKDLSYTICYYTSDFYDPKNVNGCLNGQAFVPGFLMAFIPLFFRMLQCIRQGQDNKKFFNTPFFYNFCKYFCSLLVATFSYVYKLFSADDAAYKVLQISWIVMASITVLYSFYWDLKFDWGFLESNSKNKLLRDKLSYHNPGYYYGVMVVNFVLRCTWVLSISPDFLASLQLNKDLVPFFISFLEMFRRSLWNFFRVENEHIKNQRELKAVEDLQFPIQPIKIDEDDYQKSLKEKKNIQKEENLDSSFATIPSSQVHIDESVQLSTKHYSSVEGLFYEQSKKINQIEDKYQQSKYPNHELVDNARELYLDLIKQSNQLIEQQKTAKKAKQYKIELVKYYKQQTRDEQARKFRTNSIIELSNKRE